MRTVAPRAAALVLLLAGLAGAQEAAAPPHSGRVAVVRAPRGAQQPQLAIDAEDAMHLVYFRSSRAGNAKQGNIFYVTRGPSEERWSEPIRVNSQPNTGHQFSSAQVRIGTGDTHVSWVQINPPGMWYTRLPDGKSAFEKQRDLLKDGAAGIEAGPGLVVDGADVYVVWHEGVFRHEHKRVVLLRHSKNGGKRFGRAKRINPKGSGVCACCGLAAIRATGGKLLVAFRGAIDMMQRDLLLLESDDGGAKFSDRVISEWEIKGCPAALVSMWSDPSAGTKIAWEYDDRIFFADIDNVGQSVEVPKREKQVLKQPVMATNKAGEVLVAWTEWAGAARLVGWQLFDPNGAPTPTRSKKKVRVRKGGGAAVGVFGDGRFVLVY